MDAVKGMYDLTPGNAVGINDGPVALQNLRVDKALWRNQYRHVENAHKLPG